MGTGVTQKRITTGPRESTFLLSGNQTEMRLLLLVTLRQEHDLRTRFAVRRTLTRVLPLPTFLLERR